LNGFDYAFVTNCQKFSTCQAQSQGFDSLLGLASHWNAAEFNIFGDGDSSQAIFGVGSTLLVRLALDEGANIVPTCIRYGLTGESNNLSLESKPTFPFYGTWPAMEFRETNGAFDGVPSCAFPIGEPHLSTFDVTLYDFWLRPIQTSSCKRVRSTGRYRA
jgi:hypothetical protein